MSMVCVLCQLPTSVANFQRHLRDFCKFYWPANASIDTGEGSHASDLTGASMKARREMAKILDKEVRLSAINDLQQYTRTYMDPDEVSRQVAFAKMLRDSKRGFITQSLVHPFQQAALYFQLIEEEERQ